jgi:hypothetical protein
MAEPKKNTRKVTKKSAETAPETVVDAPKVDFTEKTVVCDGFDGLNVRETPGGTVLRTVKNRSKISVGTEEGGWMPVEGGGYVMAKYVG